MADHQGVAVRRGFGDGPRSDGTASAGAILNHERLAQRSAHVLSNQARQNVVAPRRKRHHYPTTGRVG